MTVAIDEAEHLSRVTSEEVYAQNLGKVELLPRQHRAGSHRHLKEMNRLEDHPLHPRVVTEARHLGHSCHFKFLEVSAESLQ